MEGIKNKINKNRKFREIMFRNIYFQEKIMILDTKKYTEEFAVAAFNEYLKPDITEDCRTFGFEPKFDNMNHILLSEFNYNRNAYRIEIDAINAVITGYKNETEVYKNDFAGLTDHYTFKLGKNGIINESDYGYIFCDIYNHANYCLGVWIADIIDVDLFKIPWNEIEILNAKEL